MVQVELQKLTIYKAKERWLLEILKFYLYDTRVKIYFTITTVYTFTH